MDSKTDTEQKKVEEIEVKTETTITKPKIAKEYASMKEQNQNYLSYQEDFVKIVEDFNNGGLLLMLCDGHGGTAVAEKVMAMFPDVLKVHMTKPTNLEKAWADAIKEVDDQLKEYKELGCTATFVYIYYDEADGKRKLTSANLGDSSAYFFKSTIIEKITYEHKVSDEEEADRCKEEGAIIFRGRLNGELAITRAFGDWKLKELNPPCGLNHIPFVYNDEIGEGDTHVVLASDGLWDVTNEMQLETLVNDYEGKTAEAVCKALIARAMKRESKDNISVIVVYL